MKNNKVLLTVLAVSAIAALVACSGRKEDSSVSSIPTSVVSSENSASASSSASASVANVKTYNSAAADVTNAKLVYKAGEAFTSAGLKLTLKYDNTVGEQTTEEVSNLEGYTFVVKDSEGNAVEGPMFKFGKYTVTATKGNVSATYNIEVRAQAFDIKTVGDAIDVAFANKGLVNETKTDVTLKNESYKLDSKFGNSFVVTEKTTEASEEVASQVTKTFAGVSEDETYYGLVDEGDGYKKNDHTFDETDLDGALFEYFGYTAKTSGVERTIKYLYETGKEAEDFAQDIAEVEGKKEYKFTFTTNAGSTYPYSVEVKFNVDEYGVASKASINITHKYYPFAATFEQTVGVRNDTNPIPYDSLFIVGYQLKDAEGNVVNADNVINGKIDQEMVFTIDNINPDSANTDYDLFMFLENDIEKNEHSGVVEAYFDTTDGIKLKVTPKTGGQDQFTFVTEKTTLTLKFDVEYATPTKIAASVYDVDDVQFKEADKYSMYDGQSITLKGVVNYGANPAYTASLKENNVDATLTLNEDGTYTFTAPTTGTYHVLFVSGADTSITDELEIEVKASPSLSEILEGKWSVEEYGDGATVEFNDGTATVSISSFGVEKAGVYSYSIEGKEITFTKVSGDDITIAITDTYKVSVSLPNDLPFILEKEVEQITLEGTYTGGGYTFVFEGDTMTVTANTAFNGKVTAEYTFKVNGTSLTWTKNGKTDVFNNAEPYISSCTIDGDNLLFKGMGDTITATKSTGETDDDGLKLGENNVEVTYMGIKFEFTATEAGTYTFTISENGIISTAQEPSEEDDDSIVLSLSANQTVEIYGFTTGDDSANAVLTITKGGDSSGDDKPTPTIGTLSVGDNEVTLASQGTEFKFTATEAGEYTIGSTDPGFLGYSIGNETMTYGSYTGTFVAGQEIVIKLYGRAATTSDVTINVQKKYVAQTVVLGSNTLFGSYDGSSYKFTSTEAGNYTFTCDDSDFYKFVLSYGSTLVDEEGGKLSIELEANTEIDVLIMGNVQDGKDFTFTVTFGKDGEETAYTAPEGLQAGTYVGGIYYDNAEMFTEYEVITVVVATNSISLNGVEGYWNGEESSYYETPLYGFTVNDVKYFVCFDEYGITVNSEDDEFVTRTLELQSDSTGDETSSKKTFTGGIAVDGYNIFGGVETLTVVIDGTKVTINDVEYEASKNDDEELIITIGDHSVTVYDAGTYCNVYTSDYKTMSEDLAKVNESEENGSKELSLGTNTMMADYNGTIAYTFTAEVTGTYVFYTSDYNCYGLDVNHASSGQSIRYEIEAGQTVNVYAMHNYSEGEITMNIELSED